MKKLTILFVGGLIMPQADHFKKRIVDVDFFPQSKLATLPFSAGYTLTLISTGFFSAVINGINVSCQAPCLLCLTDQDQVQIKQAKKVTTPTIRFSAEFLCTLRISDSKYLTSKSPSIKAGMKLFARHSAFNRAGFYQLDNKSYSKIVDNFLAAGAEILVQSDEQWVCRIKKNLIEMLSLVEEQQQADQNRPLNAALNFIQTNYAEKITLEELLKQSFLNRETLNGEFKKRYGCTAMKYLLLYRLKIAKELLTHTGLNLNEIADATGFAYDTYFIKQFKKATGEKPTAYRNRTRKIALYQ